MILDQRTYVCRPGAIGKHLSLYGAHGFPVQSKHLGRPLMYASGDVGDPNSFVHVWVFRSAGDRERKRAAMQADPAWLAYLEKSAAAGYLISQQSLIFRPVPFFDTEALEQYLS